VTGSEAPLNQRTTSVRALEVNTLSLPTRAPRALFAETSRQIMPNVLVSARARQIQARRRDGRVRAHMHSHFVAASWTIRGHVGVAQRSIALSPPRLGWLAGTLNHARLARVKVSRPYVDRCGGSTARQHASQARKETFSADHARLAYSLRGMTP
jgi:hypothetical protein